ncbi:MAG: radical SAM family heme chaperone HemW [Clostridiales bacterium]|nr:radical SAM family heme chaperone HemW [Clostridiales bacterium]HBM79768.1 oxygen-independent coproporphyrinogen III oxidase [Clostridiaceae bacterium]
MEDIGLYIHIPFCKSKCFYCDFNSYAGKEKLQDEYVECLISEMKMRSNVLKNKNVVSIYIGGGTPTYLNPGALRRLLQFIKSMGFVNIEYSCEANPGTLTDEKLHIMKENGINRLSIGLQSWNNKILEFLGRIHSLEDFLSNYQVARALKFNNINIDLMFSIQGQTVDEFDNTLENVTALNPEHISCYSLIIEKGTLFYDKYKKGEIREIDEEIDRQMYYNAIDILNEKGYHQYEISNFARCGFECRHNIIYWKTKSYLGIGAGAHSYLDGMRSSNEVLPEKYISSIKKGKLPVSQREVLTLDDMMEEFMFMGLRMTEGVFLSEFKTRFNKDIFEIYGKQIEMLQKCKLLDIKDGRLFLTKRGIDISNQVFVQFMF